MAKKEMVIKSSGKRVLTNVKQREVWTAKIAENRLRLSEGNVMLLTKEMAGMLQSIEHLRQEVQYLRGFTKADSERLDLIVAQMNDKLTKLDNEMADVRSNVQRMGQAVELLSKRGAKGNKGAPKQWTTEELLRLDSEFDLMLHVDGEVDTDVLMDIHRCDMAELYAALVQLRKPGYEM